MVTPKVSIILPTYNVANWLSDCIQSIQAQSLTDWEAIFVNDGSTDLSAQIIEEAASKDPRISLFNQKNSGQGAARNLGVERAKGEYLFFLDPDDAIPPNALERAFDAAKEAHADIVVGDLIIFPDGTLNKFLNRRASAEFHSVFGKMPKVFSRSDIDDDIFYHSLYFMVVWMKLFRASSWKQWQIEAPVGISMGEDFMTVKKMCFLSARIAAVNDTLIYYRKRKNSSTTKRSVKAYGIFESYQFTSKLYSDLNLSIEETSLMHRSYLRWFATHLLHFTPYLNWYDFYLHVADSVIHWDWSKIDRQKFDPREIEVINSLKSRNALGFLAFVAKNASIKMRIYRAKLKCFHLICLCIPKKILIGTINVLSHKEHPAPLKLRKHLILELEKKS